MHPIVRRTTGFSFVVLKLAVFIFVAFSVMGFLSELAMRIRIRYPQPFRGVAVVAIALASALPPTKVIGRLQRMVLWEADDFDQEDDFDEAEESTEGERVAVESNSF